MTIFRKLFLLALIPSALLAVQEATPQGPPPAPVEVADVVSTEMASHVWVPGTVVSRNDAVIAAETPGQLTWAAEVGDVIPSGGVIARIDATSLELQLKNDEASIRRLEANLEYLDQQLQRLRRLTEQQIVPAEDLEQMTSQRETAQQELIQAKVGLEQTRYRLERCQVRAPFAGRVVERLQQPGGYVNTGGGIVRLVDVGNVEVRARAPLSVESYISEGMDVTVRAREREAEGRLRTVIRVGDETSRMFEVRVALAGQPWIIGSPVRVGLPSSSPKKVTAIPRDALILRSDDTYVYKLTGEDTVERVPVRAGIGDGPWIEILGDLSPGDRVVTRGGERLRPGQKVAIREDAVDPNGRVAAGG